MSDPGTSAVASKNRKPKIYLRGEENIFQIVWGREGLIRSNSSSFLET